MASTSRIHGEIGPFSVSEVIIDQFSRHHSDTAKFRAFYHPDGRVYIRDGDKEIFEMDFRSQDLQKIEVVYRAS